MIRLTAATKTRRIGFLAAMSKICRMRQTRTSRADIVHASTIPVPINTADKPRMARVFLWPPHLPQTFEAQEADLAKGNVRFELIVLSTYEVRPELFTYVVRRISACATHRESRTTAIGHYYCEY